MPIAVAAAEGVWGAAALTCHSAVEGKLTLPICLIWDMA